MGYMSERDIAHEPAPIVPSEGQKLRYTPSPIETQERNPHLRHIEKAHILLESDSPENSWLNLSNKVKPYHTGMEFSRNIRETVREYIATKIPHIKERVPSVSNLDDDAILNALTHNWFEEVEDIADTRTEVLLTVMAHVTKRIESHIVRESLKKADEKQLAFLGLNPALRDLTINLLDIAPKVDPLYVRFKAFGQLSGEPPEQATSTTMYLPDDKNRYTQSTLFPKESSYLSTKFSELAEQEAPWQQEKAGELFKQYLVTLSKLYSETDTKKAYLLQRKALSQYRHLLSSGFPVILTPSTEPNGMEPYPAPEIKISLRTKDASVEDMLFAQAKNAMAQSLDEIEAEQFKKTMLKNKVEGVMDIGAFGVGLTLASAAQEVSNAVIYLREQYETYDKNFYQYLNYIQGTQEEFASLPSKEKAKRKKFMSRINTALHEVSHYVHQDSAKLQRKIGKDELAIIDEVKAETLYRALVPSIIQRGGLDGTRFQWAAAMTATSFQYLHDMTKGDGYFEAGVYTLNNLFAEGVLVQEGNKFKITDADKYYEVMQKNAHELLVLYEDKKTTPRKSQQWINKNCKPNEQVQKVVELMKARD